MAELDLFDLLKLEDFNLYNETEKVYVEIVNRGGAYSHIINDIPVDRNLITRSVKNYMKLLNHGGMFVFSLEKNIPSGAGLGGGSGNAATAMRLVSSALGRELDEDLINCAASTGSDIPFFLQGGFAFVEGRGESVVPVDYSDQSAVILINNGIHIDTGLAYVALNRMVSDAEVNYVEKRDLIKSKLFGHQEWESIFRNDFEGIIFNRYPELKVLKDNFYKYGAYYSSMTGSGSTVYGLFEDIYLAENVYKKIVENGNTSYMTKFRTIKN